MISTIETKRNNVFTSKIYMTLVQLTTAGITERWQALTDCDLQLNWDDSKELDKKAFAIKMAMTKNMPTLGKLHPISFQTLKYVVILCSGLVVVGVFYFYVRIREKC